MTRSEHIQWCKDRALAYLPDKPSLAVTSMTSDMSKHPDTGVPPILISAVVLHLKTGNVDAIRHWIEGFN